MDEPPREPSGFDWTGRLWRGVFGAIAGAFIGWLTTFADASNDWIAYGGAFGFVVAFALGLGALRDILEHLR